MIRRNFLNLFSWSEFLRTAFFKSQIYFRIGICTGGEVDPNVHKKYLRIICFFQLLN